MSYDNLIEGDWVEQCENLWEILTGTILDTRVPLERLFTTVRNLKEKDLLDFRNLKEKTVEEIAQIFKDAGYIWYNSKARFFNQGIEFDLKSATYKQMISIKGIGDKLASMWMTIVHKSNDYPILDVHVLRFLKEKGYNQKGYAALSEAFKVEAKKANMSVSELDHKILVEGIRKRKGL